MLQAEAYVIALLPGAPDTPIWSLGGSTRTRLSFQTRRRDRNHAGNQLPVPSYSTGTVSTASSAEPLVERPSDAWGQANLHDPAAPCRHVPMRPAAAWRRPGAAVFGARAFVEDSEAVAVDRDEVFLIEDWRLRPTEPRSRPASTPGTPGRFTPSTG